MKEMLPEMKTLASSSAISFSSSVLGTGQYPQQSWMTSSNRPNWKALAITSTLGAGLRKSYKSRVAVQVDFTIIGAVPFRIEHCRLDLVCVHSERSGGEKPTQVSGVAEPLNFFCVEPRAIGDGKGMVIGNLILSEPVGNFIFVVFLDVPDKGP